MLAGLGHNALIRCYYKHEEVDAGRPRKHVFDKLFVARDIHDPYALAVWEHKRGKTQFYGNAPSYLLFQPVGVAAGQAMHQRGFPVVDMPRSAKDYMLQIQSIFIHSK